ncbi:MAG: hypothetical protein HC789_19280, partial [Microcoleus sp. CSU_2_2]|nr:hypothetical protein [Microcoleus sp. CSU_2_2]
AKPDAIENLVIGGQEGDYSAKMCVNLETALLAAKTFAASGKLENYLCWEEEKPLVMLS